MKSRNDDDGLYTPEVGAHSARKYKLISTYADLFSKAMKSKWDCRVYIDLFAGAGRAKIRESGQIIPTSSTHAMAVEHPFDHYVFCDRNSECTDALGARVRRDFPELSVDIINADCNDRIGEVLAHVPRASSGNTVLSFCVVDPYNISSLKFETIERVASARFADFLVLIPSHMDANREQAQYRQSGNTAIADFVGNSSWRDEERPESSRQFGTFVLDQFSRSMKRLGFIYNGPGQEVLVNYAPKNVKLYYLTFFTRDKMGTKFWNAARKYSDDQLDLFLD